MAKSVHLTLSKRGFGKEDWVRGGRLFDVSSLFDLPVEFGLEKYVDYDKQFVKAFLDPIKVMLDCVGWKAEKTSSLERFFV